MENILSYPSLSVYPSPHTPSYPLPLSLPPLTLSFSLWSSLPLSFSLLSISSPLSHPLSPSHPLSLSHPLTLSVSLPLSLVLSPSPSLYSVLISCCGVESLTLSFCVGSYSALLVTLDGGIVPLGSVCWIYWLLILPFLPLHHRAQLLMGRFMYIEFSGETSGSVRPDAAFIYFLFTPFNHFKDVRNTSFDFLYVNIFHLLCANVSMHTITCQFGIVASCCVDQSA